MVLITNSPDGQVIHYLSGPFGEFVGGPEWKDPAQIPENVDRLIIFNEYPDVAGRRWFGTSPKLRFCRMWDEVLALLGEKHGIGTRAVVYPNADIQYFVG